MASLAPPGPVTQKAKQKSNWNGPLRYNVPKQKSFNANVIKSSDSIKEKIKPHFSSLHQLRHTSAASQQQKVTSA